MSVLVILLVVILVVVVLVLGLGGWFLSGYNGLISLRNRVQEAWAQIDTELKRRHDLIGNLVETVKGYAAHERGTLEAVIEARNRAAAPNQSPGQQAASEGELSQVLGRLFALSEAYPDLKANSTFTELQRELTDTEDRIASARRYFNATVRELNTKVESVPTNLIAGVANVSKQEYFEVEGAERDPVKVDFGQRADIPPPGSYTGSDAPAVEGDAGGPGGGIEPPRS